MATVHIQIQELAPMIPLNPEVDEEDVIEVESFEELEDLIREDLIEGGVIDEDEEWRITDTDN
jgi:hypothetical protein